MSKDPIKEVRDVAEEMKRLTAAADALVERERNFPKWYAGETGWARVTVVERERDAALLDNAALKARVAALETPRRLICEACNKEEPPIVYVVLKERGCDNQCWCPEGVFSTRDKAVAYCESQRNGYYTMHDFSIAVVRVDEPNADAFYDSPTLQTEYDAKEEPGRE